MKKLIKIALIVVICLILGLAILHFTSNNLIPFIQQMHSGMY